MTPIDQLNRTSKVEPSEAKEMVPGDQTPTSEKMDEVSELEPGHQAPDPGTESLLRCFFCVVLTVGFSCGFFFCSRQLETS